MSQLAGKVALVTGGSNGIGAAIARRLAEEGADVALTYAIAPDRAQEVVAEIERVGRRGLAIVENPMHPGDVAAAVARTVGELGRLDILVNNACVFIPSPFEDATLDEIERTWTINIRAAIVAIQSALRHMGEGGRIIMIGSCLAQRVPSAGFTLYAMSKAALVGLTKGLARDLGSRGITVNVVQPGPVDPDMNPATGTDDQRALTATGRYGTAEDIAATVAHLASPRAGNITAAAIPIDGGYTA